MAPTYPRKGEKLAPTNSPHRRSAERPAAPRAKGNIETGEVDGQATAKRFDVSFLARPTNEECASLMLTREGLQRFDFSAREKSLCYVSSG